MTDYYTQYIAELARSNDARCVLAYIEGYARTALEYRDESNWTRHMTEIHAKAKAALDAADKGNEA